MRRRVNEYQTTIVAIQAIHGSKYFFPSHDLQREQCHVAKLNIWNSPLYIWPVVNPQITGDIYDPGYIQFNANGVYRHYTDFIKLVPVDGRWLYAWQPSDVLFAWPPRFECRASRHNGIMTHASQVSLTNIHLGIITAMSLLMRTYHSICVKVV